jgi:hypothetical protein
MQLLRIIKGVASEAIQDNLIKLATLEVWYHTNCKNKQVLKPLITETSYTLNTNPQETDTMVLSSGINSYECIFTALTISERILFTCKCIELYTSNTIVLPINHHLYFSNVRSLLTSYEMGRIY